VSEPENGEPQAAPRKLPLPTPLSWRLAIGLGIVVLGTVAYFLQGHVDARVLSAFGIVCFMGIPAALSHNLRAVNPRTLAWGIVLQLLLALVIRLQIGGVRPGYLAFEAVAEVFRQLLGFAEAGSKFVFGHLADQEKMGKVFPGGFVPFAFAALPSIIFIASFFSVLYYFGVLQFVVRVLARAMMYLMRTSGAETLSVSANVFMGQTEAPLIVRPYIAGMTQSELLTMMVGGMAHISGGLMAVYMNMGADPVGILATSVMAAPCSLYLSKLLLPELGEPTTRGAVQAVAEDKHANVIDAASAGASEGMRLALNIAAMLVAFLAFIALFDYLLGGIKPALLHLGMPSDWLESWPDDLSLAKLFSRLFAPVAVLMGVEGDDVPRVADLLGTKLVANEFVAYAKLNEAYRAVLSERSRVLATYALTGFANFGSIGIQIGGIGAMAPTRRADLARLGVRALLVGFLVTLINASIAGLVL
jgi:CNT family concentrative nucleoside transporter